MEFEESDKSDEPDEFDEKTALLLVRMIEQTLGIPVRQTPYGAEVKLQRGSRDCVAMVEEITPENGCVVAKTRIALVVGDSHIMEDLVLGIGNDNFDAVRSALDQFVRGTIAPFAALTDKITSACRDCDCGPRMNKAKIDHRDAIWTVSCGEVFSNDRDGRLYTVVDKNPPVMLVEKAMSSRFSELRPHWVKVYLARYPDGTIDGEVRIDNEIDDEAFEALAAFKWPTDQDLIWFRQFGFFDPSVRNVMIHSVKSKSFFNRLTR